MERGGGFVINCCSGEVMVSERWWFCDKLWFWRGGGFGEVVVLEWWLFWRGDGFGEVVVLERW